MRITHNTQPRSLEEQLAELGPDDPGSTPAQHQAILAREIRAATAERRHG